MKKKIILLLIIINTTSVAFTQEKDSVALEMERLNRLGDSLYKERLKRDSAHRVMLDQLGRDIQNIKDSVNQKQVEQATEQVLKQQKKEQLSRQKTMWLGLIGFLAVVSIGGIYLKNKKSKSAT